MSKAVGAWWLTLLGTEPRKNRLAPVMPLLPTHQQVVAALLGLVHEHRCGITGDHLGRDVDARVGVAAGDLVDDLATPVLPVDGEDRQPRAGGRRHLHGPLHGHGGRGRPVRAHEDALVHGPQTRTGR